VRRESLEQNIGEKPLSVQVGRESKERAPKKRSKSTAGEGIFSRNATKKNSKSSLRVPEEN